MVGTAHAVTERKRADADLRESEQRLWLALQMAGLGTFDWYIQHDCVEWFEAIERMFGVEAGALGGTLAAFPRSYVRTTCPPVGRALADSLERDVAFQCEFRVHRVDAVERWMNASGQVYRDPDGRPVRLLELAQDITEPKQAEEQRDIFERSERGGALPVAACEVGLTATFDVF